MQIKEEILAVVERELEKKLHHFYFAKGLSVSFIILIFIFLSNFTTTEI